MKTIRREVIDNVNGRRWYVTWIDADELDAEIVGKRGTVQFDPYMDVETRAPMVGDVR